MKITFRQGGTSQTPVSPAQPEMRDHKRRKAPVRKVVLIVLCVAALVGGGIMLYKRNILYTYGMVSGGVVEVTADVPTEIQAIFVAKGDIVKKGDVLFTQYSVEGESRIRRAEAALESKLSTFDLISGDSGEERDYAAPLQKKLMFLDLEQQGNALARERMLSEARFESRRLKTLYEAKKERHENLEKLYRLDATTLRQVRAAETEKDLRYHEYVLARDHYNHVVEANRIAEAEAEKSYRARESTLNRSAIKDDSDVDGLLSEIERARAYRDHLRQKYGSGGFRAPFDAIITEVNVSPGVMAHNGEPIMSCASLNGLWVDVYVAPDKAGLFTEDKEIFLYIEGQKRSIPGTLTARGRVELPVPDLLRVKLPKLVSAVYFHVAVENDDNMHPGNIVRVVVK
ncbi:HlyD family secretion protein [Desulfoluna spongiiphila]|uniref:Biotin-lipoyl like n=1 Tax=Desulfoluna spongiiphila TaxID=419481 RepID=A0A1G5JC21_9BACT|nr:HlyD family efflux transporter periplasmic adaptor subunit [Desulfoluna spongiiphila]SCY85349.1 Biotin-lipoyl like [Desulfoluna spongiiphila]VVS94199.1 consensus disorder prediction [Desulfoluna spongiiphila]